MSQKTTRRGRRQTTDEDPPSFKAPTPKPNGTEEAAASIQEEKESTPPPPQPQQPEETEVTVEVPKENDVTENDSGMVTRSRSATPQVKKLVNGHEEKTEEQTDEKNEELNVSVKETEEVADPIASDEPDPELVFEETSDLESERASPVLSRCKTRRSQTRNIPTPKTPRMEEETPILEEEEEEQVDGEELNATFESCSENASTKVEVGGDSTRLDYMEKDVSNLETNSFLQGAKNKSFGETLRHLSTRRTIRPISDEYRKRLQQNNLGKQELSMSYPSRNSVERISSVGLKRKSSEESDGSRKRLKGDSPGFFSKFTSPLANIRNTWRSDLPSSTPKLTGYKDEKFLIEDDNSKMCEVNDGERRWCSIM